MAGGHKVDWKLITQFNTSDGCLVLDEEHHLPTDPATWKDMLPKVVDQDTDTIDLETRALHTKVRDNSVVMKDSEGNATTYDFEYKQGRGREAQRMQLAMYELLTRHDFDAAHVQAEILSGLGVAKLDQILLTVDASNLEGVELQHHKMMTQLLEDRGYELVDWQKARAAAERIPLVEVSPRRRVNVGTIGHLSGSKQGLSTTLMAMTKAMSEQSLTATLDTNAIRFDAFGPEDYIEGSRTDRRLAKKARNRAARKSRIKNV